MRHDLIDALNQGASLAPLAPLVAQMSCIISGLQPSRRDQPACRIAAYYERLHPKYLDWLENQPLRFAVELDREAFRRTLLVAA